MTDHGTYGGYQQHKLRGELACDECLMANRAYKRSHQSAYMQDPAKREAHRRSWMKYRHGILPEQYDALLTSQGGCCAICQRDEPGGRSGRWHIDHDHICCSGKKSCGRCIRGLLCASCNMALGLFRDNPGLLVNAVAYLGRFRDHLREDRLAVLGGERG